MPTRHATRFTRSSFPLLLREYGEPTIYYADGVGGGRPIIAIVERDVAVPSETGDQVAMAFVVRVLDSVTLGISATEIDDAKDEISLPIKTGGVAERRKIGRRINDANGVVRFVVR